MPSVPLMSARPSLASSSTGAMPGRRERLGGRRREPVGVAHLALPHQRQRAVRERREVTGAAEAAVLVDDRRDAGGQQRGQRLGRLQPDAGAAGRQRGQPQQHQRPHDLALDLGPGAGRVRAHQRPLQLRAHLGRGCAGWPARRTRWRSRTPGWARPPSSLDGARAGLRSPSTASALSSTPAPSRATATTSSKETGPTPTVMLCVMVHWTPALGLGASRRATTSVSDLRLAARRCDR